MDPRVIQADFDRIAKLDPSGWSHNSHYHPYLLKKVPQDCAEALEIGCGTGTFSRSLAQQADSVTAIDLSPEMIEVSKARSDGFANIQYQVADVLKWEIPDQAYDFVVSIATLHHMPLDAILQKMKAGLKPGGVLVVLDLFAAEGLMDGLIGMAAIPYHFLLRLIHTGRLRDPLEVRKVWAVHGVHDRYLPLAEVRRVCREIIPGAQVRQHLLWRYSICWIKGKEVGST